MPSLSSIVFAACVGLASGSTGLPEIAIIIDDIGYRYDHSRAAIELRQSFAYAILPFSPHAQALAHLANVLNKDVMVHLPMEADDDNHLLGPGALRLDMSRQAIEDAFLKSLAAVPYAVGINNHMGSRLTRERSHMNWLMHAIRERGGLFFVDSRTTSHSVAGALAHEAGIATTDRDVFLDNIKTQAHIREQLYRLVERAKKNGRALGIAHPHPQTIQVLRDWQPLKSGINLVRISEYVRSRGDDGKLISRRSERLGSTTPECSDQRDDTNPAQNPDTQR